MKELLKELDESGSLGCDYSPGCPSCTRAAARIRSSDIDVIAANHYGWVERMGWHNKTVLEALALIASEVGEAVNECRGAAPTPEFASELADIVLRVADLAHWQGVGLADAIAKKMALNEQRGTRGRRI